MFQQFQSIGRDIFLSGLTTSHGGNMSVRIGDHIVITRTGSMLGRLEASDLVQTTVSPPHPADVIASSELGVHRAIYQHTTALAVVHAHPVHAVALSFRDDKITPPDLEGAYLLGSVPVIEAKLSVVSGEAVDVVPPALAKAKIAVIRGHGTFAIGQHLEEAFHWTSVLEQSCRIALLLRGT